MCVRVHMRARTGRRVSMSALVSGQRVKCENDYLGSGGTWGPRSIPIKPLFVCEMHKHSLRENAEVKGSFGKAHVSAKDTSRPPFLNRFSKFALNWDCGETFEGLVRETCPAVTSMCFKLGISHKHTLTHRLIWRH